MIGLIFAICLIAGRAMPASGQPPEAGPPADLFDQPVDGDGESLPIQAFMFQSKSGSLVMVPSISWEKIDELIDADAGVIAARQRFSYQSMTITGAAEPDRAELEVTLQLSIEPTDGSWIAVPLRMESFHRIAPADVSGVDEYFMALDPDGGNLLFVKTNTRSDAMLRMKVAARVDRLSSDRILEFSLPDVPSRVELTCDTSNVEGEVTGRGDETLNTRNVAGLPTQLIVESSGGNFDLRWGPMQRTTDERPLLEVDSNVRVRWDSPQSQPIARIRSDIRSLRGSVDQFQLRLPKDSLILDTVRLGTSGQAIELGTSTNSQDGNGEVREIVIPEEEQQQRIVLEFDLQLANDNATAESPFGFRVPDIVGALTHRGQVEIETGTEYRLRWNPRAWIRSVAGAAQDDASSNRLYRFRYDRASFDLPELEMWLGTKGSQLRLTTTSTISIGESVATIDLSIQCNVRPTAGKIDIDNAQWQLLGVEDEQTGETLETVLGPNGKPSIELESGSDEPVAIRVRGEQPIQSNGDRIQLPLPRVLTVDDGPMIKSEIVEIQNLGRSALVVDTSASSGLSRVAPAIGSNGKRQVSRFRLSSLDLSPAVIVGTLTEQPLRIRMTSGVAVELAGDRLQTTINWRVTPDVDLGGRLPIRIPQPSPAAPEIDDPNDDESEADGERRSSEEPWVVTVGQDNAPATLRSIDSDRYELISERLADQPVLIRWRRDLPLRANRTIESIAIPRPGLVDVIIEGTIPLELQGNEKIDLIAVDAPSATDLGLATLPREPLRLRLQTRDLSPEDLSILQTILRTAVGHNTRHEQLLVQIQGGDQFRVGLPSAVGDVSVDASIDGRKQTVLRDGSSLILSVPGDSDVHLIDLRVWVSEPTPSSMATIEPVVQLPIGSGSVLWQIVAPSDGHVVWASPTLGRNMAWQFDGWRFYRRPRHNDANLTAMVGSSDNAMPAGNRYLYVGSDLRSFQVVIVSRAVLWACIGSLVLLAAFVLANIPRSRHPLTAVVVAVMFAGLLAIAPDAAVLAGQLGIIALVLVIIIIAIRSLIAPARSDRIFTPTRSSSGPSRPSTRSLKQKDVVDEHAEVATTQTQPPSPSEASS